MNFQQLFNRVGVPILGIAVVALAYRWYGWPGVVAAATGLVLWMLLHFNRVMAILKRAADRPMGYVDSAVMLNAKLRPGVTLDVRPRRQDLDGRAADGRTQGPPMTALPPSMADRDGKMARRQDPRAEPHPALRLRRLRGRARLQHRPGHRDLPAAGAHRAAVQQRQDPAHEDPLHAEQVMQAQCDVVRENKLESCYLRPLTWIGDQKLGVSPKGNTIHLMVAAWPWGAYLGEEGLKRGIRVKTSSYTRHHVNITMTQAKAVSNYTNSHPGQHGSHRRRLRRGAAARFGRFRQRRRGREPVRHQEGRGLHARPVGRRAERHHPRHHLHICKDLGLSW
jgi:hypothetical protein